MASLLESMCFSRLLLSPLAQFDEDKTILIIISVVTFEICSPIMILFALVTNALSTATYIKMGLSDSITVSFVALSFSDACRCIPKLFIWFCETLSAAACVSPDPRPLSKVAIDYSTMFFDISTLIMIYISIQRCLCIALPLQCRFVFTRNRVTRIIAAIYGTVFLFYIPRFAIYHLELGMYSTTNTTEFKIVFTEILLTIKNVHFIFHVTESIAAEIIIIICLGIFARALIASFRFRMTNGTIPDVTAQGSDAVGSTGRSDVSKENTRIRSSGKLQGIMNKLIDKHGGSLIFSQNKPHSKVTRNKRHKKETARCHRKDLNIIKVVALTSAVFVFCNFAKTWLSITQLFIPGFDRLEKYHISFTVIVVITQFCEYLNSDVNLFVYLKYNIKFKDMFYSTFMKRCCQSSLYSDNKP